MARSAVLYDRDCRFCETIVDAVLSLDRDGRLRPVQIQSDEGQRLLQGLPEAERLASFHLVRPGGEVLSAGPALTELVRLLPAGAALSLPLARAPRVTQRGYAWVAANRVALSRFVPGALKRRARRRVGERLEHPAG